MYVLWTNTAIKGRYILSIKKSIYEIEKVFNNSNLGNFSSVEQNDDNRSSRDPGKTNFYVSEIENCDADKNIYVFIAYESSEGGRYHSEFYFAVSNDKKEILDEAEDYFVNESRNKNKEHIDEMLDVLTKNGYYEIPECESYICDMEIYEFLSDVL